MTKLEKLTEKLTNEIISRHLNPITTDMIDMAYAIQEELQKFKTKKGKSPKRLDYDVHIG
jgi:hypothetical protein